MNVDQQWNVPATCSTTEELLRTVSIITKLHSRFTNFVQLVSTDVFNDLKWLVNNNRFSPSFRHGDIIQGSGVSDSSDFVPLDVEGTEVPFSLRGSWSLTASCSSHSAGSALVPKNQPPVVCTGVCHQVTHQKMLLGEHQLYTDPMTVWMNQWHFDFIPKIAHNICTLNPFLTLTFFVKTF